MKTMNVKKNKDVRAEVSATFPNGGFNNQDFWENTMLWTFGTTGVWVWHSETNLPRLRVTGQ